MSEWGNRRDDEKSDLEIRISKKTLYHGIGIVLCIATGLAIGDMIIEHRKSKAIVKELDKFSNSLKAHSERESERNRIQQMKRENDRKRKAKEQRDYVVLNQNGASGEAGELKKKGTTTTLVKENPDDKPNRSMRECIKQGNVIDDDVMRCVTREIEKSWD